jgi:hypothetical protein
MSRAHCWGCGELIERVADEPLIVAGRAYCSTRCVAQPDDEPQDFDAQDRRAADEERIELHRRER